MSDRTAVLKSEHHEDRNSESHLESFIPLMLERGAQIANEIFLA
ncbi:hypothetical protein [Sphingomonas sanguinis]|nr:hypothetical protein [Sphingomonas sanguinis]